MTSYFSDFSGNIFECEINKQGTGSLSLELNRYLVNTYGINKLEFALSERFIVPECRDRITDFVDALISFYGNDYMLDHLYVVGPCYRKNRLDNGEIKLDYQAIVTGTPYYLGGPVFDINEVEPTADTIHREVQEETYLSINFVDQIGNPVQNHDVCLFTDTYLPLIKPYVRPCLHVNKNPIFGAWALKYGLDRQTPQEISEMEARLLSYRKGDSNFYRDFQQQKIAVSIIGEITSLLNFYTAIVPNIPKPPHFESRINDLGVIMVPLRLIHYILTHGDRGTYISNRGRAVNRGGNINRGRGRGYSKWSSSASSSSSNINQSRW
jgi:hypothetical protein